MAAKLKKIEEGNAHTIVGMEGSLDMAGSWDIERELIDYISVDMRDILIDMSAVDFLGSMGIRVLVRSASALQREKKKLILFAAQPSVENTLRVTGFSSAIPVVRNLEDAKAAIAVPVSGR